VNQQERLRVREAADWFARMHGPDAAQNEAAFLAWIAESENHRDAYSRVSEAFSLGKNLTRDPSRDPGGAPTRSRSRRGKLVAAALALVIALGGVTLSVERYRLFAPAQRQAISSIERLATGIGEIRTVRLSDGSTIVLDTNSELSTRFGADQRDLWLLRGRARFDVAHERRPFVVHAGGGTVTAHGTLFDVRLGHGAVSVRLLRGAVDVAIPARGNALPMSRKVVPGESVTFDVARGIAAVPPEQSMAIAQPAWPSALLDFDRARVADILAEANRYSSGHQIVASPDIADKRVSGTFRVDDADRLAQHLAVLLDARANRRANGDIVLAEPAP